MDSQDGMSTQGQASKQEEEKEEGQEGSADPLVLFRNIITVHMQNKVLERRDGTMSTMGLAH